MMFKFTGFLFVKAIFASLRKSEKASRWIMTLGTSFPLGMNLTLSRCRRTRLSLAVRCRISLNRVRGFYFFAPHRTAASIRGWLLSRKYGSLCYSLPNTISHDALQRNAFIAIDKCLLCWRRTVYRYRRMRFVQETNAFHVTNERVGNTRSNS